MKSYSEFLKRWNITEPEDSAFLKFKHGVLRTLRDNVSAFWNSQMDETYSKKIFYPPKISFLEMLRSEFGDSTLYISLKDSTREEFFYRLEALFATLKIFINQRSVYLTKKKMMTAPALPISIGKIRKDITVLIEDLQLQVTIREEEGNLKFYPAGVPMLDEKLVDDVLNFLEDYPAAKKNYLSALEKYSKKTTGTERNIADDLRLSLELLLKSILKNDKSLEKQQSDLGSYLESKNVKKEIRELYSTLLSHFIKYQNEHAKHDDNVGNELEFVIYLTGAFMRFIAQLEKNKNKKN